MEDIRRREHLFLVRIWREQLDETNSEWRGRIQSLPDGPVSYFREWQMLVDHLIDMLPSDGEEQSTPEKGAQ